MKPNSRLATLIKPALVLLFFMLSSCALTQEHINVGYTPEAGALQVSGAAGTIVRVQLDDQRTSKGHVGHKSNAYGMEMAQIIADNDIPQTVKSAVESELTSRGFTLGPNGTLVLVKLIRFDNRFTPGFWSGTADGRVTMIVTVTHPDGRVMYTKTIYGESTISGLQLAGGNNARIALEAALKDAVTKLFSDNEFLNSLLAESPKASKT